MADKNSNNEEEYQFSSDVDTNHLYGSGSVEEAAAKQQMERSRQMKKFIVIGAICIIMFLLYKISNLFQTKPAASKTVTSVPQAKTQVPQLNLQPTQNNQMGSQQQVSIPGTEKLETMQSKSKLQADVDQLKEAVTNLQATVSNTNETLQNLSNKMEQQASLLEREVQLLAEMKAPKKPVITSGRKKRRMMHYYIEAMIPGRAWLKGQNGETQTVRVGDMIRGYEGEVAEINTHEGVVKLSSGETIMYRADDR